MRIQTVILCCAFLAICLVKRSATATTTAPSTATTVASTGTTTASSATATTTASSSGATTTASSSGGNAARRRLLRRIRILQRRLQRCRRDSAHQRKVLLGKIKSLTASSQNNLKPSFNKLFG